MRVMRRLRVNHGLLVLAHHRIGDPRLCPYSADLFSTTPEGLAAQVRLLRRWSRLVTLEEVTECYSVGRLPAEPAVLLTFDDVYRDNYTEAFPILREARVPAAFFVPTGLIERGHIPWWDRIAYAVKHSHVDECRIGEQFDLRLGALLSRPHETELHALRYYKSIRGVDKERFVELLEEATGAGALEQPQRPELFATWAELREMAEGGMTLASHTHTHRLLGHLPYREQLEELVRSRAILRERTGVDSQALAYPVGHRTHFNDETRQALRDAGYRLAFSHYGGWNRTASDPFDIRRVRMEMNVGCEMLQATLACPRLFSA
jgi:peptidoglycan/xylan/chitin deacetylase (PgdA/CDA1 family)